MCLVIAQTHDGYLWIGTNKGLFRSDGFKFVQVPVQLSRLQRSLANGSEMLMPASRLEHCQACPWPVFPSSRIAGYHPHTALDLTFCIRGTDDSKESGFYLIKAMGSEQSGLTGVKGSIVRKVAVGRSASSLEKSLAAIKNILESKPTK